MPVLSPHRSSASALAGTYRSTFSSSTIDRPFFSSTSYNPRITSYSERYTSRSYADSDGRRLFSRSGSITEDGITSRFREETRETSVRRDSLSRDSGISSIRENSIAEFPRRDSSISRSGENPRLSAINVHDSVAELRSKYSPANYVPACLRERNENISRSKSINDIGLPPIESKSLSSSSTSATAKKKVNNDGLNYNNSIGVSNSNTTNDNNGMVEEDDNGNKTPSVADLKKKFDDKPSTRARNSPQIEIEGVKISENRFKKQDLSGRNSKGTVKKLKCSNESAASAVASRQSKQTTVDEQQVSPAKCQTSNNESASTDVTKLEVNNDNNLDVKNGIGEEEGVDLKKNASRVNNFASYIPARDYQQKAGECLKGSGEEGVAATTINGISNNTAVVIVNGSATDQSEESKTDYVSGKRFAARFSPDDGSPVDVRRNVSCRKKCARNAPTIQNRYLPSNVEMSSRSSLLSNRPSRRHHLLDISTSPKLNTGSSRSVVTPSSSTLNSNSSIAANSLSRRSNERDSSIGSYELNKYTSASPVKSLGLNGLKNIGNTCFMNSVIQCLSNTKLLLEYLLKDSYVSDVNTSTSSMRGALIKSFAEVIKELWSEDASDRVVNTSSLKSQIQRFAPRFIGYAQQDAQEFLRYLLEGLHEDVNRVREKPRPILTEIDEKLSDNEKSSESWMRYLRMDNSKIVDYFVGQLKSTLKCTHCGHCSVTFDPFWDLSLPIPQRAGQVRLAQCLDSFTREETLDGDEKPTCSKCKERRKCTKSFTIQKFPKILVIHLKRFSLAERFRGKLSVTVDFPLEGLDMSHYAADHVTPCRYNLYAISNHSGTTYSGHYTAYCRHPYTKSWHEYNDSRVSAISSKSIVSGEAYVLFYEQEGQKSHL